MIGSNMLFFNILLCLASFTLGEETESKVVQIDQGPVRGYKSSKGNHFEFTGIPYATAPTGTNKYKAPLPPPQWTDTFEANRSKIYCPQIKVPLTQASATEFQEDCLVANVYVPDIDETNLPVLVIVHGGSYHVGNGNTYTAHALIEQGKFIVVNFNYRLGVHGFLCLGTEEAPGNAGLKDQLAALRWIKKNIAHFGGNPDDITLSGYSAGSSCVDHLMLSETTEGLFNKVNGESGSALSPWGVQMEPIENAKLFAKRLGQELDDFYSLQNFYLTASYDLLTSQGFSDEVDSTLVFVPCVERDTGSERILKETPYEILKNGNYRKVPFLAGFSNKEGILRIPNYPMWKDDMNVNFEKYLPADLKFSSQEEREAVARQIKEFYFGNETIGDSTLEAYVDYFGDYTFAYPIVRTAKMHAEIGNDNVYLYQYSYIDDEILAQRSNELARAIRGAEHCFQTRAILESGREPENTTITDEFQQNKAIMRELWINFFKTGKPLPETTSTYPAGWPAVTAEGSPYMDLNLPANLQKTPLLEERIRFWDEIYDKYYRLPSMTPDPPAKV